MQRESPYEELIAWFRANGGGLGAVNIPHYSTPDCVGVSAAEEIPSNSLIMSIPKQLVIGVSRAQKQLKTVIKDCQYFQAPMNDELEFAILTVWIVKEWLKGKSSFFWHYLSCASGESNLLHWTDQQILDLNDPLLTIEWVRKERRQGERLFKELSGLIANKPQQFGVDKLEAELFWRCYGLVLTRSFGWGLPQTMLVPMLDMFNHHSNTGVHHFVFSHTLETAAKAHPHYVRKSKELNLNVAGMNNRSLLPKNYRPDSRQVLLQKHWNWLKHNCSQQLPESWIDLPYCKQRQYFSMIQAKIASETFEEDLLLSSDSEDNDTDSDDQMSQTPHGKFLARMLQLVDSKKQEKYSEPGPWASRQWEEGVSFDWWWKEADAKVIVATSHKVAKGEEIFNSYGHRNSRFLLAWYGFSLQNNKYHSLPLVISPDGKLEVPRDLSDSKPQFKLKAHQINYQLMAYLRLKAIGKQHEARPQKVHIIQSISLENEAVKEYQKVIKKYQQKWSKSNKQYQKLSEQHRMNAHKLIKADIAILEAHQRGIKLINWVLGELSIVEKPSKKFIKQLYRGQWPHENVKFSTSHRVCIQHYFQLLNNFFSQ